MRTRFLNMAMALGLIIGAFAAFAGGAAAGPEQPGQNRIFFPYVFAGDSVGANKYTSTIYVQNVEGYPEILNFYKADGTLLKGNVLANPRASIPFSAAALGLTSGAGVYVDANWADPLDMIANGLCNGSYTLVALSKPSADGSQTFTIDNAEAVGAVYQYFGTGTPGTDASAYPIPGDQDYNVFGLGTDYIPNINGAGLPGATVTIDWSPKTPPHEEPTGTYYVLVFQGNTVDSSGSCGTPRLAGVEKHISADGHSVDGYNAVPVGDMAISTNDPNIFTTYNQNQNEGGGNYTGFPETVLDAQNRWVLPIVQTNGNSLGNWNSIIYITNMSQENGVTVNATFYPAEGQGVWGPSVSLTGLYAGMGGNTVLNSGETMILDLKALGAPDGVVGSVWIDSSRGVVAMVARQKDANDMALTNVAQPRTDQDYNNFGTCYAEDNNSSSTCNSDEFDGAYTIANRRYAPLVFRDYNGWNTGINIANLSSQTNQVTVEFFNYAGISVTAQTVNIPPRAMEYVYIPASNNSNIAPEAITSAIVTGTYSLAAQVDEVKYMSGAGQGMAMSYAAQNGVDGDDCTAYVTDSSSGGINPYTPQNQACGFFDYLGSGANAHTTGRFYYESQLSLPLLQKGDPTTGLGPTSGINLFNPDNASGVEGMVQFVDSSGLPVAPTTDNADNEQPFLVDFGPLTGKILYTFYYSELPAGFTGSAIIGAVGYNGDSNEVNTGYTYGMLVGVSNNVDYGVSGDGAAVYNMAVSYHETYTDHGCDWADTYCSYAAP